MLRIVMAVVLGSTFVSAQVQEEIQVLLRQVRVHVLDENGDPVKGLSKDDFLLSEGKSFRNLSTFEEIDLDDARQVLQFYATDANAKPLTSRSIVILIDSSSMEQEAFEPMINAIQLFIERDIRENDLVKVVQLEQRLIHLSEFTSSKAHLQTSVGNAKYTGHFRRRLLQLQSSVFQAYDALSNELSFSTVGTNTQDALVLQTAADRVIDAVDEKEREKMMHTRTYRQALAVLGNILGESPGSRAIYLFTGGGYVQTGNGRHVSTSRDVDHATRVLNAKNVTLYSFLHTSDEAIGSREQFASRVNFNDSLQIRQALERYASREHTNRIQRLFFASGPNNTFFETQSQIETGPRITAEGTGGFFLRTFGRRDMSEKVAQFTAAARHYYTLGYTVEPTSKESRVKLELVEEHKGWRIVFGEHVANPVPFNKWSDEDRQLSFEVSLLYSDTTRNDLDAEYGHLVFSKSDDSYVIPMYVTLPRNTRPEQGYEVGMAVFDADHRPYDLVQNKIKSTATEDHVMFYNVLLSSVAPRFVKFFVRNLDTGEYALQEFETVATPITDESLWLSPVVLSSANDYQLIPINHLDATVEKRDKREPEFIEKPRKERDPLTIGGVLIRPSVNPTYPNDIVDVFFHVTGIKGQVQDYEVRFNLVGERSGFVDGQIIAAEQDGADTIRFAGKVDLRSVAKGTYRLDLQVLNRREGQAAVQSCELRVGDSN